MEFPWGSNRPVAVVDSLVALREVAATGMDISSTAARTFYSPIYLVINPKSLSF